MTVGPAHRAGPTVTSAVCSDRTPLQAPALPLGQSAPDAEPLVVLEGVLKALATHLAAGADPLRLPGGPALLREEGLRVGLGAQRSLLPPGLLRKAEQLGEFGVREAG